MEDIHLGSNNTWDHFSSTYIFNEGQEELKRSSPERVMFIAVFLQSLLDATKPEYEGEPRSAVADFKMIMNGEREFTYRRINILLNATKT